MAYVLFFAARREIVENNLAALFENFPHLAGKIQIRFETQGTGDVVKESPLDRDGIDDVLAEERAVEFFGYPDSIVERRLRMFRTIERNKDVFDHASLLGHERSLKTQKPRECLTDRGPGQFAGGTITRRSFFANRKFVEGFTRLRL